jgi:hypothetical protein
MNSKEELIAYFVGALPESLHGRVLETPWVRNALNVSSRYVMNLAGWASIDAHHLFTAVSTLFTTGAPQIAYSLDKEALDIMVADDVVVIRQSQREGEEKAAKLPEWMLLSTNREQRLTAWSVLSQRLGPAVPAMLEALPRQLAEAPVDETTLMALIRELSDGVYALQRRSNRAMRDGQPTVEQLVPNVIQYYATFCGPVPTSANVDEYVASSLTVYRSGLVSRDRVQGLDICLMGGLRADLSPIRWVEQFSNDDLWRAFESIDPMRDPYSAVNSLDLALARLEDARFEKFARSAVEKLTTPNFSCGKEHDGYELLALLSTLVLDRLNGIAEMNMQPPFWKRMCAWMHGAVLLRIVQEYALDVGALEQWVNGCRSIAALFTRFRDLRAEPMYRAADMSRKSLVAEVAGRLELLVQNNPHACEKVGLAERLATYKDALSETDPYGWFMCGPLEGHRLPRDVGRKVSDEDAKASLEMIETRDFEHMWFGLSTMSQLCDLTEPVLQKATERTNAITQGKGGGRANPDCSFLCGACRGRASRYTACVRRWRGRRDGAR